MLIVLALLFWFNYKAPLTVVHIWENHGRTSNWSLGRP
jgi:hypothetical protein